MITLLQLSVGRTLATWFNWQPGIYYFNFDGNYSFIDSVFLTDVETIPGITSIGSVFSDNDQLTQVFNTDDLVNGPSFYYDSVDNGIYIRLANYDPPDVHQISVGPVYAISDEPYIDPSTLTVYEARLLSSANVDREKDALFFGTIIYTDFTVQIANADGSLYDLQNWDVYGQPLKLLYGNPEQNADSFAVLKTGVVKEYKYAEGVLEIKAQDSRRILEKTLPVNNVLTSVYANADRDKNKTIPVVYGSCRRVTCRVLNDGAAPSTFNFICADCADHPDGIFAINAVYVDGQSVTPSGVSLTAGTFNLSSSQYQPGQTVTADVDGYVDSLGALIDNPLDIIKDIIEIYLELPYNTTYFDVPVWDAETLNKPSVNYAAIKKTKITDIAEKIGASLLEGLDITPDNKFTWFSHRDTDPPLFQIQAVDWIDFPEIEFSSDEAVSTATIGYDRNWTTGDFKYTDFDDNYAEFVQKFKVPQDQIFETVLSEDADADDFAEELGNAYADVQIFISGEININQTNTGYTYSLFNLKPGQNVDAAVKDIEIKNGKIKYEADVIGRFKAEIIKLTIDPEAQRARFMIRYIEPYDVVSVDAAPIGEFVIGLDYIGNAGVQSV